MQSIIIYFVQLNEMVELQKEVDKISTEIEELYQKRQNKILKIKILKTELVSAF